MTSRTIVPIDFAAPPTLPNDGLPPGVPWDVEERSKSGTYGENWKEKGVVVVVVVAAAVAVVAEPPSVQLSREPP